MGNNYFKRCMKQIFASAFTGEHSDEEFADKQLLIAVQCSMVEKLSDARGSGKNGWWNHELCNIEFLYQLRDKAIADNDHVSVLNYTAMIAMRESVQ